MDPTFKLTVIDRQNIDRVLDNENYVKTVRIYIDKGMEINQALREGSSAWNSTISKLNGIAIPVRDFFPGKDYITVCRQTKNLYQKGQNQGYTSTANICIEEFGSHKNIIFVSKDTPILIYDLSKSRHATSDNFPIYEIILPPSQNLIYLGSVDRETGEYVDQNPGYTAYTNFYVTMPSDEDIIKRYPSRDDFREYINQYTLKNLNKFMPQIREYANEIVQKDLPELVEIEENVKDITLPIYNVNKVKQIQSREKVQNTMTNLNKIYSTIDILSSLNLDSLPCPRNSGVYKLKMRGPTDNEEKSLVATERKTVIEASSAFVQGLNQLQESCPEAQKNSILQQAIAMQQIAGVLMSSNVDAVMTIATNPNLSEEMKKFLIEKHYEAEKGRLETGAKLVKETLQTIEKVVQSEEKKSLAKTTAEKEVAEKGIKAQQEIASQEIELQAAPGKRQARDKYCYWLISASITLVTSGLSYEMVQKYIVGPLSRVSTTLRSIADQPVALKEAAEFCKEHTNKWFWEKNPGDAVYCNVLPTVGSVLSGCKYYFFAGLSALVNFLSEVCKDSGVFVAVGIVIIGLLFALLLRKFTTVKRGFVGITSGLEFDEGYIQPSIGAQTKISSGMMLQPSKEGGVRMITEERSVTQSTGPKIEEIDEKEVSQGMRKQKIRKSFGKKL